MVNGSFDWEDRISVEARLSMNNSSLLLQGKKEALGTAINNHEVSQSVPRAGAVASNPLVANEVAIG